MKRKPTLTILIALLAAFLLGGALSACAPEGEFARTDYPGVKVVYELEGGKYGNSTRAVRRYYQFPEGAAKKITALLNEKGAPPERAGYRLDGWYRTRTEDGEHVEYSDPWDFAKDTVEGDSLTLYAKWRKLVEYTFDVVYFTEEGEEKLVTSYPVDEDALGQGSATFSDYLKKSYLNYASVYPGHTVLCALDGASAIGVCYYSDPDCTEPWDPAFTHPGGEQLSVKVYVKFMKGVFTYVSTPTQLVNAADAGENIYLLCDIDMSGKTFYGFRNAKQYKATLLGNDHTISNVTLSYDATVSGLIDDNELGGSGVLLIGLFGNLSGAHIENVTFEGLFIDVKTTFSKTKRIIVAPLSAKAQGSTVKNVTVKGSYSVSRLPQGFAGEDLVIVGDAYYLPPDGCTFEGNEIQFTEQTA